MTDHPPIFPDTFNMADYFVFSNIEAGRGGKIALHFEGHAITYREVAEALGHEYQAPEAAIAASV